jgi:malonyl-CoA O-methyltransferase
MSSKESQLHLLDKKLIRQSFDAAADHYDDAAVLQREIGERLIERLELIKFTPQVILDVGAGTGFVSRELDKYYKTSQVLSMDIAPRMLHVARSKNSWLNKLFGDQAYICGDAEFLPFADNSVDLIISNLTLQWCGELERTFAEFKRVLKPEGLLMFSSFGPDTLKELRESWHEADTNADNSDERMHVNDFIDMHDMGDALLRAGLSDPVMDVDNITLTYSDVYQLMRELKALGAHNVANARRHSLTGKTRLRNMVMAYENYRNDGVIPATYEVVYGHAWGVSDSQHFEVTLSSLTDTGILS